MKCTFLLILLFTINHIASAIEIHNPETQDDYFTLLWSKEHIAVGYYDSKVTKNSLKLMKTIFESFSSLQILEKWDFALIIVDLSKIEMLHNHYSMQSSSNFYYFIRKQLVKCPDFDIKFEESIETNNFELAKNQAQEFLFHEIDKIVQKLTDLEMFESQLEKEKIIGIFFGDVLDQNFALYEKWTALYHNFAFFYTFDEELKKSIFKAKTTLFQTSSPMLAIIRSDQLLTAFDEQKIVWTSDFKDEKRVSMFFEFERNPKLLDDSWGNNITHSMFFKDHRMLLYVSSDNSNEGLFNIYQQAVSILPKRMIYSYVNINSINIASYMQLFMLGKVAMQPEKIYVITVLPTRTVEVLDLREKINVQNILKFVNDYIGRNRDYFGIEKSQEDLNEDDNNNNDSGDDNEYQKDDLELKSEDIDQMKNDDQRIQDEDL